MGVAIDVSLRELDRLQARLDRFLVDIKDPDPLLHSLAGLLEAQTKRRISDEKEAPDGTPWRPWDKDYAKTRNASKHSLLIASQALLDDIAGQVEGDAAVVGSSMIYAGPHQKTRPFLGLSHANETDIVQMVEDWIAGTL